MPTLGFRDKVDAWTDGYTPGVVSWIIKKMVFPGAVLLALFAARSFAGVEPFVYSYLPPEITLFTLRFTFAGASEASTWLQLSGMDAGKDWAVPTSNFFQALLIPTAGVYVLSVVATHDANAPVPPFTLVAVVVVTTVTLGILAASTHVMVLVIKSDTSRDKTTERP